MSNLAEKPADAADPTQNFGTAGIKPLARPSLVTRVFMAVVAFVERLNLKYSKVGNPPIYDNAVFPWTEEIEREWRAIRAELDRVLTRKDELPGFHELSTDVATISQDRGWKTFLLCGYGFKSDANIKLCPKTWRICQKIPGLITVMFSILEPGKHLPPHRGPYNGVLRLHLGLIVPEPREQLGIRVEHSRLSLEGRRGRDLRRRLRARGLEPHAAHARGAVRRFHQAAALSGAFPQLAAAASRRVHALHPRGHGQPEGLGKEVLRGGRGAAEQVNRPALALTGVRG